MSEKKQQDEFEALAKKIEKTRPLVEPTDEEKRNGWTAESLTDYLVSQETSQTLRIDPNSAANRAARRPRVQNHRYNPKRWRG